MESRVIRALPTSTLTKPGVTDIQMALSRRIRILALNCVLLPWSLKSILVEEENQSGSNRSRDKRSIGIGLGSTSTADSAGSCWALDCFLAALFAGSQEVDRIKSQHRPISAKKENRIAMNFVTLLGPAKQLCVQSSRSSQQHCCFRPLIDQLFWGYFLL